MSIKVQKTHHLFAMIVCGLVIATIFFKFHSVKPEKASSQNDAPKTTYVDTKTSAVGNTEVFNTLQQKSDSDGVKNTWQYIIDTYGKDSAKQEEAHDYAHYVGKLIYEKEGLSGMTICTSDFAFGCYHGLLDQAFRKDLSPLHDAEKACQKVGAVKSGPYASCIHGIGHGVASFYKDRDLKNALKTCDQLPDGAPQYCYDGVFMEFSRDAVDGFYKSSDPLYPCNAVDSKYVFPCGRNLPSVLMNRMHLSYTEVAQICQKAKDINLRTSCYVALGFQAVYLSQEDPSTIITQCEILSDDEFEYQCKSAAAGELIFQNMQDWQTNSPSICNTLPDIKKTNCISYITTIQKNYNRH